MKTMYHVPTDDHFTVVSNLRDAKRLARLNGEGSQWFDVKKHHVTKSGIPLLHNMVHVFRWRFDGRKWN